MPGSRRSRRLRAGPWAPSIRESVATYLAHQPLEDDPALGILGLFADEGPWPLGDVAEQHDAYLAEAYAREGYRDDSAP